MNVYVVFFIWRMREEEKTVVVIFFLFEQQHEVHDHLQQFCALVKWTKSRTNDLAENVWCAIQVWIWSKVWQVKSSFRHPSLSTKMFCNITVVTILLSHYGCHIILITFLLSQYCNRIDEIRNVLSHIHVDDAFFNSPITWNANQTWKIRSIVRPTTQSCKLCNLLGSFSLSCVICNSTTVRRAHSQSDFFCVPSSTRRKCVWCWFRDNPSGLLSEA